MRAVCDPNAILRKRVIEIITRQLRASLDGNPRPAAEVLDEVDAVIADDFSARLQAEFTNSSPTSRPPVLFTG
jgi:hypothetical protein